MKLKYKSLMLLILLVLCVSCVNAQDTDTDTYNPYILDIYDSDLSIWAWFDKDTDEPRSEICFMSLYPD